MILKLEEYKIPRKLMEDIMEVIDGACFIPTDDGDEMNDDDVLAVSKRLHECLVAQHPTTDTS